MVRTIEIIFLPCVNKLGYGSHISKKSYSFLCTYDEVQIGDLITDLRYSEPMKVINIHHCTNRVQGGFTLKDIIIDTLNGKKIVKSNNDARTLNVTIEQAREWYKSGNKALETLALNVYTQKELELNYESIKSEVLKECLCINVPREDVKKVLTTVKLAVIAKYFNKSWVRTHYNTGYFIRKHHMSTTSSNRKVTEDIDIFRHDTVVHAGIIYFKTEEDAFKAAKMLGDEVKNLF